jgi:hypothetical protein
MNTFNPDNQQEKDPKYLQALSLIIGKVGDMLNEYIGSHEKYNSEKFGSPKDWREFKEFLNSNGKLDDDLNLLFFYIIEANSRSILYSDDNEFLFLNSSLAMDESWLINFDSEISSASTNKKGYDVIAGPLKSHRYLMINDILNGDKIELIFEKFDYKNHPYVHQRKTHIYLNSKLYFKGFSCLFEGVEKIINYPNYYWNNDLGMYGSSWLLLLLVQYVSREDELKRDIEYTDLIRLTFLYITRTILISSNNALLSDMYVNRARLVMKYSGSDFFGLSFCEGIGINPELQYISDLHMAHHVWPNLLTYENYAVVARTWYQNGSPRVNNTGGYAEMDDRPFGQIVNDHVEYAKLLSFKFFKNYYKKGRLTNHKFLEKCKVAMLNHTNGKYKDDFENRWKEVEDNIIE